MTDRHAAREEILARIDAATADIAAGVPREVPPQPRTVSTADLDPELMLEFVGALVDYRARVVVRPPEEVAEAVAEVLAEARSVVVPAGLDRSWLSLLEHVEIREDEALSPAELDSVDAVVTAARVGIASTGTIVLDHAPDQGRRAITLVPDHHVCVIRVEQVVADVPDAVSLLDPTRPLTWISGPSATSDIELNRVEGVHGPRTLDVVIVADED
jgi:L-lactate dehydrogenase complex protein LldG